jgi:archaellum biogenesis ATPase FlaH
MKSLKKLTLDNFTHSDYQSMEFVRNRFKKIQEDNYRNVILLTEHDKEIFEDVLYSLNKLCGILRFYYNEG